MEGSPKCGGCARAVCAEGTGGAGCGFCADPLGGRGAWRVTLFIVHPHWWAAGPRAGRRNFAPWDVPYTGELVQCTYDLPRVLPEGLPRTDPTAPPSRDLSAAPPVGWPSAFRRPVRLPACVSSARSPSLASRARLLALYPGCGLRELAEVAGRRGPGGRGFLAHIVAAGGAVVLGDLWAAA